MRMLIYIAIAFIGLLMLAIGITGILGSRLPETHTASMSIEVGTPIDKVWAVIDDVQAFPTWLTDINKIEMLSDREGRRAFRQTQGRNSFVLEETVKQPPTLVTRTITDDSNMFTGSWEHRFEDLGNGRTRITITENGKVSSVIPRAIMHYTFGEDYYLKKFGDALKAKFGT